MSDLVVYQKSDPPKVPEDWDFRKADASFDGLVKKWRRLTEEADTEMWYFYVKLKVGHRPGKGANSLTLPTWLEWLESKGISHPTPIAHFQRRGWLPSDSLVSRMTGNQENYTPKAIIDSVREVMGTIDLDPASCEQAQEIIQAKNYFTESDDGLTHPWVGNVFLNPPYKMPLIRQFTDKLIEELSNIENAIMLTNDQCDTLWFQKCAHEAKVICFPKGRIGFYTPEKEKTAPTNGQAFQYFGANEKRFIEIFRDIGLLVRPLK